MNSFLIRETDNGWLLPLEGRKVNKFLVDYQFCFQFYDEDCLIQLIVENNFVIEDSISRCRFSSSLPEGLGPALTLFHQVVRSAEVFSYGELRVEF